MIAAASLLLFFDADALARAVSCVKWVFTPPPPKGLCRPSCRCTPYGDPSFNRIGANGQRSRP